MKTLLNIKKNEITAAKDTYLFKIPHTDKLSKT